MHAVELLEIHPSSVGSNPTIESVTALLRRHVAPTTNRRSKQAASVRNKMVKLFPGRCCATIQRVQLETLGKKQNKTPYGCSWLDAESEMPG